MASLKNSPGLYCLEQKAFEDQIQYREYTHSQIPVNSKLPGLGINVGNMRGGYFNNVLSNNASNIESHLLDIYFVYMNYTFYSSVIHRDVLDKFHPLYIRYRYMIF